MGHANPYTFENLTIVNNLIVTTQANAISFAEVDGLKISNNTLVYSGDLKNPDAVDVPGITYRLAQECTRV